jgi:hypothetical protein
VSIGIAVSSAGRGGGIGDDGGDAGIGDACRLAGFVSTLIDFERVISLG